VVRPVRNQIQFLMQDLEATLPEDHQARAIWDFLDRLDLSDFYATIRAVQGGPGRPASDPQVLLALWVYATVEGVGSARKLGRLCREHDAYRWLCGGVPVDYHLLSDFRVEHQEALDGLLTQIVATLMAQELVTLAEVAQDGVRVRAGAARESFRRQATLEECLVAAQVQVARLAQEREHPDPGITRRERAAKERAAQQRLERVEQALTQLPQVQAIKERQRRYAGKERAAKVTEARVSTTDPEARVMRMPDGGFRPAYNLQLATDVGSQVIVGVAVVNRGTDQGEALAMESQIAQRAGRHPEAYLIDGGFVDLKDISTLERNGVRVYAPPKERKQDRVARRQRRMTPEVLAWRGRMETPEGQAIYQHRLPTAEGVNAQAREKYGMPRIKVRGLGKFTCVALLMAITHDLLRWMALSACGPKVRQPLRTKL
jgi:transposase